MSGLVCSALGDSVHIEQMQFWQHTAPRVRHLQGHVIPTQAEHLQRVQCSVLLHITR